MIVLALLVEAAESLICIPQDLLLQFCQVCKSWKDRCHKASGNDKLQAMNPVETLLKEGTHDKKLCCIRGSSRLDPGRVVELHERHDMVQLPVARVA